MWKISFLLILCFLPGVSIAGVCVIGAVQLTSQGEVDRFQVNHGPDCYDIEGSIGVFGDDITNLDGLAGITAVSDYLEIFENPMLVDTDGLLSLTSAGEIWFRNNDQIVDLSGFANLEQARSLRIYENESLENLDGLSNLLHLTGPGILSILSNSSLVNIDGLANLQTTNVGLALGDLPLLTSLSPLSGITSLSGQLSIGAMIGLPSLNGLHNIETLGENGWLRIFRATGLTDLNDLTSLTGEDVYIDIRDNTDLESIEKLSDFTSLRRVEIFGNPNLQNLSGLENFGHFRLGLEIFDNDSLTNVDELAALRRVDGPIHLICGDDYCTSLRIQENDNLQNLEGLSDLEWARGSVIVTDNPSLNHCFGLEKLLNARDDGELGPGPGPGTNTIPDIYRSLHLHDNAVGCNSVYEFVDLFELDGFESQ